MHTIKPLTLPESAGEVVHWHKLYGCAQAESIIRSFLTQRKKRQSCCGLVLISDITHATDLEYELIFFANGKVNIHMFPDWETLPYDIFSPHQDIIAKRIQTLESLSNVNNDIYIIATDTLLQKLPPLSFIHNNSIILNVGDELNIDKFRHHLNDIGYFSVMQVTTYGEYAVRGSIIDFFPPASTHPIRIDLFDDEIESLRTFNPSTQISMKQIPTVKILPAREFPLNTKSIIDFRTNFRAEIDSAPEATLIYRDISSGIVPGGIEYYLPLFFNKTAAFFDYLAEDTIVYHIDDTQSQIETHWENIKERYTHVQQNTDRPPLKPEHLFLSINEIKSASQNFRQVFISQFKDITEKAVDGNSMLLADVTLQNHSKKPAFNLKKTIDDLDKRILIVADTAGYREQLIEILAENDINLKIVDDWQDFLNSEHLLSICIGKIQRGAFLGNYQVAIIADKEILGHKFKQYKQNHTNNIEKIFYTLNDLELDCPVVHENYGIGRYQGLINLTVDEQLNEFLLIEYADKEKVYVPVNSLHLITRYTGGSSETAPLHKLGGEQWNSNKRKAAQKAFDVAVELLDTQARRDTINGITFNCDFQEYKKFIDDFPYQETPDQLRTMEEILEQMQQKKQMDRVICGDVGFGKTEIAMRAIFVAVQNGYQTVVLAPTTLLTNQHFQNFRARFADWPIRIALLSRFVSSKEQKQICQEIENGTMDIIIATHKILYKKLNFKRLGLIVIDEEQRFGVRHKEKLKTLCSDCDLLTLTATPIPRTLNMSLSGLRDLSIIATPPLHRYAVKTFVSDWNDELIAEACHRELRRGGQVYFVHNKIKNIMEIADKLRKLIPETDIRIAHGRMQEKALENTMTDFYRKRFAILVCTTIIENGIDIPTANSIIINQAENMGLSQLHQLRGRVGRSHHRAYAYLLLGKPRHLLPGDALKRLEVIESIEDLGVGFSLASQDLEIRGAGELLGEEQSGHIHEVGFTMYNKLLKQAIKVLRSGKLPNSNEPLDMVTEVNLGEPAIIPEEYIPDTGLRLILYRRIAAAETKEELYKLKIEMTDRFGLLPNLTKCLFINAEIRLLSRILNINKIEVNAQKGILEFNNGDNLNMDKLITLIQANPDIYSFEKQTRLLFKQDMEDIAERVRIVKELITHISYPQVA